MGWMVDNDNSDLENIIQALLKLQTLKIERVFDVAAETTLLCTSFDAMNEVRLKRDQEIADINAETEKQLKKYNAKN